LLKSVFGALRDVPLKLRVLLELNLLHLVGFEVRSFWIGTVEGLFPLRLASSSDFEGLRCAKQRELVLHPFVNIVFDLKFTDMQI